MISMYLFWSSATQKAYDNMEWKLIQEKKNHRCEPALISSFIPQVSLIYQPSFSFPLYSLPFLLPHMYLTTSSNLDPCLASSSYILNIFCLNITDNLDMVYILGIISLQGNLMHLHLEGEFSHRLLYVIRQLMLLHMPKVSKVNESISNQKYRIITCQFSFF